MTRIFIRLVLFVFLSQFLVTCRKGTVYTIKGRFVEDCSGLVPVANEQFEFICHGGHGGMYGKRGLNMKVTTNSNGEFVMNYNSKDIKANRIFIYPIFQLEREDTEGGLNPLENIDLGDFAIKPTINGVLNIVVNNSYTSEDTLFILDPFTNGQDTLMIMPGPFYNLSFGPNLMNGTQRIIDFSGSNVKVNHFVIAKLKMNGMSIQNVYATVSASQCDESTQQLNMIID